MTHRLAGFAAAGKESVPRVRTGAHRYDSDCVANAARGADLPYLHHAFGFRDNPRELPSAADGQVHSVGRPETVRRGQRAKRSEIV